MGGYSPLQIKERVINLSEKISSLSFNIEVALIGLLNSDKNTMAFYRIEELNWPHVDNDITEYDFFDFRTTKVRKCKPGYYLYQVSRENVSVCVC